MISYLTIENLLIKKIIILFIIYLSIFLSFSYVFGDYHNTIDYRLFSNQFFAFEISYPSDWEILDYTPVTSIQQLWGITSKFEVTFGLENLVYATSSIQPTNLSLQEYSQQMVDNIQEKVVNEKVFPVSNNISISDYPAYQVKTKWQEMNAFEIWTVNESIAYRFSFFSPSDRSDNIYSQRVIDSVKDNMTKSFRLKN